MTRPRDWFFRVKKRSEHRAELINNNKREGDMTIDEVNDLIERLTVRERSEFIMLQNDPLMLLEFFLEHKKIKEELALREAKLIRLSYYDPLKIFYTV